MKILFTLTRSFNPNDAGVQRTTYKLGKFFTEQGHTIAYYSTKTKGHVPVEYGSLYAVKEEGELNSANNIEFLKKTLYEFSPDIVINQMPYEKKMRKVLGRYKNECGYVLIGCLRNSLFSFLSNVRLKIKLLLPPVVFKLVDNKMGITIIRSLHVIRHRIDLKSILNAHDYYVLLTPQNKDELRYFVGDYQSKKVLVIPNSIPSVYPEYLLTKRKIILYVGSLNIQQKRADLLLDFWQEAFTKLPDWEFKIVGHGVYADVVARQIKERQLPRVTLEGYQKPEPYYADASLFIMTSAYEGFPNTILEAQSHGVPVVTFKSYAALESIVNDRKDALLITPYDIHQMAEQTISLATAPKKLRVMQQAAIDNASRYTIDNVGKQWLNFFNSMEK